MGLQAARAVLHALLSLMAMVSFAFAQTAADFPTRPVKLVVPFAAGGPTGVVARILADLLSERWGGQSAALENRPGAAPIIATPACAQAPCDRDPTLLVA